MPRTIVDRRRLRGGAACLLLAAACLAAPAPALAQDKAAAEALFQEGKKLLGEGKFDQACPKLAASQRQDPSPGTLLNLGKCHEGQGKTASAWAEYKEAATMARTMGRSEQEAAANERATAIEPKLSKLKIDPPPGDFPGLVVKRGASTIDTSSLGVPLPIDPGEHTIEASAPGYKTWSGKVTVGANADQQSIAIGALEKGPDATGAGAGAGGTAAMDTTVPDAGNGSNTRRTVGFVLAGVGVAALGVGAVFGILASGQAGDAEDDPTLCPGKVCTDAGREEIDGADTKALISTIGFGVGIAAAAAGVVLIVTSGGSRSPSEAAAGSLSPARSATPRSARVVPAVGPNGGGVSVIGRF
jgi:hypothetical protein